MPISEQIKNYLSAASWIRRMFEEGEQLRQQYGADNIFDFSLGNPEVEPPEAVQQRLQHLAQNPSPGCHRYMPNAGYGKTRQAVASHINQQSRTQLEPEHIIMTCGAGGGLNVVLKTLLNAGEEVLVPAPYFVEYRFYAENHGGTLVSFATDPETFLPDADTLAAHIGPQTRVVLINSPNNPTWVVYPPETLQDIARVLQEAQERYGRSIYLVADEPYAQLILDASISKPCVFDYYANSIVVTSFSKDLALPGERIGYLAAHPQLQDLEDFLEGAVFCNRVLGFVNAPALQQRLITGLLDTSVDVAEYAAKRDLIYAMLTELGFKAVRPRGGFYLFPRSPWPDDVAFVRQAQQHRLLLVPGSGFGMPGHFRVAFCVNQARIRNSYEAWEQLWQACRHQS